MAKKSDLDKELHLMLSEPTLEELKAEVIELELKMKVTRAKIAKLEARAAMIEQDLSALEMLKRLKRKKEDKEDKE